ncbi:MAG: hypothetical protein K8R88_03510 [Armatimonadetes bacterium]|nr:hypothetical protein [Armatimonadota bacterium]
MFRGLKLLLVLCVLSLAGLGVAQDRLAQAAEVQSYFHFKRTGYSQDLTSQEVMNALNVPAPNGSLLLDQAVFFAGNVRKLDAFTNGRWVEVHQIDVNKVFKFMFTAGGAPYFSLSWLSVGHNVTNIVNGYDKYRDCWPYINTYDQLNVVYNGLTTVQQSLEIIDEFVNHVAGLRTNFVLDHAWSAYEDPETTRFYLQQQTGMINYFNDQGRDFVEWGMTIMDQRATLQNCAYANAHTFAQDAQRYIDGFVEFSLGFDHSAAPAKLLINDVDARAGMGDPITNLQFIVNGTLYESIPTNTLLFWGPQQVTVTVRAFRPNGNYIEKTLTTNLYQDYFQVDVDRDNFRATLTFPNNERIQSRVISPGFGTVTQNGPIPGGATTVQFPLNVLQTYDVSVVSTTTNGNQMSSNRTVNLSAQPLTFNSDYTCYPGDTFTVADSPVKFYGDLIIPEGTTLTLRRGVVLQFAPNKGIKVRGRLECDADPQPLKRVYMAAMNDNSAPPLGGADNSGGNYWTGITITGEGTTNLRSSSIRRAWNAISNTPSLSGCNISECRYGVSLKLPGSVTGCNIQSDYPLYIGNPATGGAQDSLVISGNIINGDMSSGSSIWGREENPLRLTLTNNQMSPIRLVHYIGSLTFSGNTGLPGSGAKALLWLGQYTGNPARFVGPVTLSKEVDQRVIVDRGGATFGYTGLVLAPGGTLTLANGMPLHSTSSAMIKLDGGALLGGVLTCWGDERDFGGSGSGGDYWGGVTSSQASHLTATTLRRTSGFAFNSTQGGDVLRDVRFETTYGVSNSVATPAADARGCWWGSVNGPSLNSPQTDRGAVVSGNVLYDPWLGTGRGLSLKLRVQLQDYSGEVTRQAMLVEVHGSQPGATPQLMTLIPDNLGNLTIPVEGRDAYRVRVRGRHWLSAQTTLKTPNIARINPSPPILSLINGDVNGDDVVDLSDYTLLVTSFNAVIGDAAFNADADLNGDGVIDLTDYTVMVTHFNAVGVGLRMP